jgi:hypothetical protein
VKNKFSFIRFAVFDIIKHESKHTRIVILWVFSELAFFWDRPEKYAYLLIHTFVSDLIDVRSWGGDIQRNNQDLNQCLQFLFFGR